MARVNFGIIPQFPIKVLQDVGRGDVTNYEYLLLHNNQHCLTVCTYGLLFTNIAMHERKPYEQLH
jgi:hypothetical protein